MKKKILITCLLALTLSLGALAWTGCGCSPEEEKDPPAPKPSEAVTFSNDTNPYASKTWQEYKDLCDWTKKAETDKVYYQFEGSYSEAYNGDYSRTYLYMNCYEDGLLHATYRKKNSNSSENYYGYWTNLDKKGNTNIILHIIRYNDKEYNDGVYESVVDNFDSDYYEYSSSIIWNQWGTRTVLIYGFHYSPVKSVAVDPAGATTKYKVGDNLSEAGVGITVTRENGRSSRIENPHENPKCVFTGYDKSKAGKQTITVSYDGKEDTYDVDVTGVKTLTVDTSAARTEYDVGDNLDTNGIKASVVYDDGSVKDLKASDLSFKGFDAAAPTAKQTVTVEYFGKSATYDITVKAPTYKGTGKYGETKGEVSVKLDTAKQCTVTFNGKSAKCAYSMSDGIITLGALAEGETGVTADEWQSLHKQYSLNRADYSLAISERYEIKDEIMGSIPGGTVQRYLIIDEAKGECKLTYKYWYASNTDTFVCKYTKEGNTLTLTEKVSQHLGGGGASFEKLPKTFTLNGDGTAVVKK